MGPFIFDDVDVPARGKEFRDGLLARNPTIRRSGEKSFPYYMVDTKDGNLLPDLKMGHAQQSSCRRARDRQPCRFLEPTWTTLPLMQVPISRRSRLQGIHLEENSTAWDDIASSHVAMYHWTRCAVRDLSDGATTLSSKESGLSDDVIEQSQLGNMRENAGVLAATRWHSPYTFSSSRRPRQFA